MGSSGPRAVPTSEIMIAPGVEADPGLSHHHASASGIWARARGDEAGMERI